MLGDIGVGILLSIFITWITGVDLTSVILLLGVSFALLPDIDFIGIGKHRGLTHRPILYVPIILTLWLIIGKIWALFFALGVYAHLIHDTLWIGTGIKWLWPFKDTSYKFFNQERPYTPGPIMWIEEFYLRPTVVSVTEALVFMLALISLYFQIW